MLFTVYFITNTIENPAVSTRSSPTSRCPALSPSDRKTSICGWAHETKHSKRNYETKRRNCQEQFNRCGQTFRYRKLLFSLAWFHAILLERRKFKSLGFNVPYEFNESDFSICHDLVIVFLDEVRHRNEDSLLDLSAVLVSTPFPVRFRPSQFAASHTIMRFGRSLEALSSLAHNTASLMWTKLYCQHLRILLLSTPRPERVVIFMCPLAPRLLTSPMVSYHFFLLVS